MTADLLNNLRNSSPDEGSHDLYCRCLDAAKEITTLREQVAAGDALRISMSDVPENILDWASYASEHFQEKYGMQGDADRYKKALSVYDAAISKGEAI